MLTFSKLSVEGFGPFKENTVIEMPENGVVTVYGENMRGKTSLLNAIRYALFGTVLTRHGERLSINNIENWQRAEEGKYGFKVILNFKQNGSDYELTRECRLRPGITTPQSDTDYEQVRYLMKDGQALGPDVGSVELTRIMPESVSRFFLFDGELLQQYEELLRDESQMGVRIKEAIERILGVPVLTDARTNVKRLHDEAQKAEAKAAQKNQKTQELGNQHDILLETRASHEAEVARLKNELLKTKSDKAGLDSEIKKTERLMALFSERERLNKDIEDLDVREMNKQTQLQETLASSWRGMLRIKIGAAQQAIQNKIDLLRSRDTARISAKELTKHLEEGFESGCCPTCARQLDDAALAAIKALKNKLDAQGQIEDVSEEISQLNSQLTILRKSEAPDIVAVLEQLVEAIEDCQMEKHKKRERIGEINERTKSLDESKYREITAQYDRTIKDITILEQGIVKENEELTVIEGNIQKVEKQLELLGGADLASVRRRREMLKRFFDLLNEAVGVYRNELRERVEADATSLFTELTTEPDYAGLRINANYGLTNVQKDGRSIPVRSAGAEHIVALSLMGALQKNAPFQGPIIMDSPFGRLDTGHTTRVVKALPKMSQQVILLIYEAEMEPNVARQYLLGHLKKEYEIVRRSAIESCIEVRYE